jgi:hypothetical protein
VTTNVGGVTSQTSCGTPNTSANCKTVNVDTTNGGTHSITFTVGAYGGISVTSNSISILICQITKTGGYSTDFTFSKTPAASSGSSPAVLDNTKFSTDCSNAIS